MDQPLLTVADAARRLGVTPAAVVAMERGMRLFVLADVEHLGDQRAATRANQQSSDRKGAPHVE
jgi:hypothetical protein